MKVHRIANIILVLIFITAIFVPLITVNKTSGKVSVTENRKLADFPKFKTADNNLNLHFINDFELWLNDNLGYRDKMVIANTVMQYEFFGKLTKTDTVIGKDNWLYYVTPEIIKDYQNLNLPTEVQLEQWARNLIRIDNYLKSKDISFITMLNLDKKTIYPEFYPNTILKAGSISRTDIFEKYIKENTDLDFFTPKDALLKAKSHATVYSPRVDNAHWNKYGAFVGYLELIDRVKAYYPNVKKLSFEDYEITTYQNETKIYNAISFSETDQNFKLKNESKAKQIFDFFNDMKLINNNLSFRFENEDKSLPKVLVFGDSYIYGLLIPELAESFSEFTFIHSDNIDKMEYFVDLVKPEIVIFENVERMLDHTMEILSKPKEGISDFESFKNLPILSDPVMYLDYYNNNLVEKQGEVMIDRSQKKAQFDGWVIDSNMSNVAGGIFLKVGDNYYPSLYGTPHQGVSDYFENPLLLNSGFSFKVDSEELIKEGQFSFVIISNDRKYQYTPVEYKVIVK